MLFQLNPSSSMIINRARLTSAAGETRDRVNDTNARRSSLVRLKTDCMLHIVLLKSMLHNTSPFNFAKQLLGNSVALAYGEPMKPKTNPMQGLSEMSPKSITIHLSPRSATE